MVLPFVVDHAGGIDAVLQDVLGCSGQQAECESKPPEGHIDNSGGTFTLDTHHNLYPDLIQAARTLHSLLYNIFNASRNTDVPVFTGGHASRRRRPIAARTYMCRQRQ